MWASIPLKVREGTGGLKPLTDADRADIKTTISEKILLSVQHPVITFTSAQVTGTVGAFQISGDLTILRQNRPLTVYGGSDDGRLRGHATITQTQWRIKPYSVFARPERNQSETDPIFRWHCGSP